MKLKSLIGTASLSTLAAAMALTALPAEASARDHGNNGGGWSHQSQSGDNHTRSDAGASRQGNRGEARSENRSAAQGNGWARQPQEAGARAVTPQQSWFNGRGEGQGRTPQERTVTRTVERSTTVEPNRTYGNPNRNRTYADGNRNRDYGSTTVTRTNDRYNGSHGYNGNRDGHYDGNNRHYDGNNNHHYQGNYNRWNNNWRNDRRYDWHDYRNSHRNVYHLGRYYSPYRDWSYRPLSVGFYLDSLFYSDRYWIDDPWQYRLPDAYGPYHWVRYYDDALLVDVYTGEVVDVIPNFFW